MLNTYEECSNSCTASKQLDPMDDLLRLSASSTKSRYSIELRPERTVIFSSIFFHQALDVFLCSDTVYHLTQTDKDSHPAKTAKQRKQTTYSSPPISRSASSKSKQNPKSMLILSKQLVILLCYDLPSLAIHPSMPSLLMSFKRQGRAEIEIKDAYRTNTHYIVRPLLAPCPEQANEQTTASPGSHLRAWPALCQI